MDQRKRTIIVFSIALMTVSIAIASAAILENNISLFQPSNSDPIVVDHNDTITNSTTNNTSTHENEDITSQIEPNQTTPTTHNIDQENSSSNGGTITTNNCINLYTDSAATIPCTEIEFATTITPGSNSTKVIFIKNEGDTSQVLHMTTSDWQPSNAESYISISWNRENYSLTPGSVTSANLTLSVASDFGNITTFGFNLTIGGSS